MDGGQSLKEAIRVFLKHHNLNSGIDKVRLKEVWFGLNKTVADQTINFDYYNGTLFITIKSAVLKNELIMQRTKLIDRLNDELGKKVVTSIRIT